MLCPSKNPVVFEFDVFLSSAQVLLHIGASHFYQIANLLARMMTKLFVSLLIGNSGKSSYFRSDFGVIESDKITPFP